MSARDPAGLYLRWSAAFSAVFRGYGIVALVYFVVDADLDPLQLVLLGTALEVSVLIGEIPTGVVADTLSRKWSMVVSHLLMGAGMAATGLTTDFLPLLATQFVWGFGWTFTSGADIAWVTDELDDDTRIDRVLAAAGRWRQLGAIVGLLAAGGLAWATSLSTALIASGLVAFAIAAWIAARFPEHNFTRTETDRLAASWRILRSGASLARSDHQILLVLAATLLLNSGAEAVDRLFVRRLVDLGLPETPDPIVWFVGLGIVGFLFGAAALRWVEHRIAGEGAPRRLYVAFVGLASIGTLLMAVAPTVGLGLAGTFLTRGVAFAVIPVVAATWVNQRAISEVRATVQSFLGQAESIGEITGGLVLGAVAQTGGVPLALTGSAALFAASALLVQRSQAGRQTVSFPGHRGRPD